MAGLKDADDFQKGELFKGSRLGRKIALIVGVAASVLFFVIATFGTRHFEGTSYSLRDSMAYSWLFAVVFFLSLGVGGLFWTLLHHATNSGWGVVVRRQMENIGVMIPVMLFCGLPLVLPFVGFRDTLWEWFDEREEAIDYADKEAGKSIDKYVAKIKGKSEKASLELSKVESEKASLGDLSPGHARFFDDRIAALKVNVDVTSAHFAKGEAGLLKELKDKYFLKKNALLYAKRSYLNPTFWTLRFLVYALVLGAAIIFLRATSIKMDQTGDPHALTKLRGLSCLILLPFAVSWTFLVVDWLMALDYAWFSTMWGVYLFAGAALNSMGLLILVISFLRSRGQLGNVVNREHYHMMGKLMHAFVIFWAYIAFSQFFLIWYANITEETKFFLTRNTGFWNTYSIVFLVVGHFFIPFLVLLVRYHKTTTWIICTVAIWNLMMHVCDIYWIIMAERAPSLTGGEKSFLSGVWVFDILAFVGVGGIFVFALLKMIGSASLYPSRDPRLDESLNLMN